MPERFSDEHLRLLEQGIPVYPGDEALIADFASQRRTFSARWPDMRDTSVTGAAMAGNVTPRFGMDTARQGRVNLGLPPAKRKIVEKIVDDPNTPNTVTTTIEDEIPRSQNEIMMEQFQQHKAANTVPSSGMFIQSALASAPEQDPEPRQDDDGNWWFWDKLKGWIKAAAVGIGEQQLTRQEQNLQAAQEIQRVLTETTGERNRRLAEIEAESNRREQPTGTGTGGDTTTPTTRVDAGPTHLPSTYQQGDPVSRIYGDWSRDIPTERKEYLRAMKDIYFKMSMLSAVASLTGGEDQSEGFGRMQVEMLNYMMETDNQDRLLKIHKGVYFNKDGKWDPPKNERVAHQRAVRFGAGPEEASEFSGHYPKTEGIWQNWIVTDAEGNEFIKASQGGPPPGYVEFRLATAGVGLGKERFRTFRLEFFAATTPNGKRSVATRYARALKEAASGGFMYQPPTEGEIEAAFNELKGDFKAEDIERQD